MTLAAPGALANLVEVDSTQHLAGSSSPGLALPGTEARLCPLIILPLIPYLTLCECVFIEVEGPFFYSLYYLLRGQTSAAKMLTSYEELKKLYKYCFLQVSEAAPTPVGRDASETDRTR